MVAARLANLAIGRPAKENAPIGAFSNKRAALSLNVGSRSVQRARVILRHPEWAMAVDAGEMTVAAAEKAIKAAASVAVASSMVGPGFAPGSAPHHVLDRTGFPIPPHLVPLWNRVGEARELRKVIARALRLVKVARTNEPDPLWADADLTRIADLLQWTKRHLRGVLPHTVCLACDGHASQECPDCRGRGFLSRQSYDRFVNARPKGTDHL